MGRTSWMAAAVVGVALMGAPAGAQAQAPAPQLSFLAHFVTTLTVERLSLEDGFLIRMPAAEDAEHEDGGRLALPHGPDHVVALLGSGLSVASPGEEATPVLLQLKPTFARRGGVVRFTFRF